MLSTRPFVIGAALSAVLLLVPRNAQAQFSATPFSDPATGERYHIEAAVQFWNPPLNLTVSSAELGIPGTSVEASTDLGLTNKQLIELRLVARPARKHKFRFNYLPMRYSGQSVVHKEFVFNGQRFGVNLPLTTELEWTTMLLSYEYDFLYYDRWFVGFSINSKFTKVRVDILSPIGNEFALAQAPIPTFGGVVRVYVVPNISVTADINGIKLPEQIDQAYRAHYFDFDLYGTVNFNDYVGAQLGYRSIDVGYKFKQDEGSFLMKGIYFGGVVRY